MSAGGFLLDLGQERWKLGAGSDARGWQMPVARRFGPRWRISDARPPLLVMQKAKAVWLKRQVGRGFWASDLEYLRR